MRHSKRFLVPSALILSASLFPQSNVRAQNSPTPTVTVYTREVTVDINVTDANGNPVHGLTRENFTVLENNQPMIPRSFHEHRPDAPAAAAISANPSLPPNTFTNAGPPEGVQPLFILLFDSLDTPVATQSIIRQQMVAFTQKLPPDTHVSVMAISPTGQLSVLQGFTTDPALLKKAINSHKLDLGIPPLEDAGQDTAVDTGDAVPQNPKGKLLAPREPAYDQNVECAHAAARVQYTSNAFAQIARYTSGMPGRKNLIWYTGAFPARMKDKQGTVCYDSKEDMSSAGDLLEHSHVIVYPIDPRALDILAKEGPDSRIGRVQAVEHLTMESVAGQTGGKAIYNTNDMAGAGNQAIDSGLSYYTINYVPTNQNFDTRRRTINITVDQPNLTLVYKKAYDAVPPGGTTAGAGRPIEKATPVQSSMMRGALQPTQILFHVGVTPAPATDATLPAGNNADPKTMKPPYRHLSLTYTVDAKTIQFDQSPDGAYHSQFEYAVDVYDNDGRLLNSSTMAAKPALPAAVYQSMLANGVKMHQEIAVPAKGDYTLRIGLHDLTTDHVGALEVPTTSITP